jgi:HlyD family secretion protein
METDAMNPDAPKPAAIKSDAPKSGANKSDAPKRGIKKPSLKKPALKKFVAAVVIVGAAAVGYYLWTREHERPPEAFASGNGRIEATQVDVATKYSGRIQDIFADEGDSVVAGQRVAIMDVKTLQAQRDEAVATHQKDREKVAEAEATVTLRERERDAQEAVVRQREAELDAAQRRLARSEVLATEGAASEQELDDDRARTRGQEASVASAVAQLAAARQAVIAAQAQVTAARAQVAADAAAIQRIDTDLTDNVLTAPRGGRVQYRVAEPGEVLSAGGKVLNMVDLGDVYMTFFLPEAVAGKVALGAEARIVLDAAPQIVIPAYISYVASVAQFTPKTVETAIERQKLTFRVKAQISRELLKQRLPDIKTGLPGVAWVKLDPLAQWPPALAVAPELNLPAESIEDED